ncbi:MAG: molybdopterin-dependent oxidoreductase, partial [Cyanobacteria bacterium]|nr:molybdopterin-dependent oxidoreductase [Cyanobacteriota bacterium]
MISKAQAQCPYCGVGCGLELLPPKVETKSNSTSNQWTARGDRSHPSSLGQVCIKGATVAATLDQNRLTQPLWRPQLDQPLQAISWERAYELLVQQIKKVLEDCGPDGLAVYGSGQFLTEDYYLAQKLFKGYLGCNNFDANSRLCMSSAVAGYSRSLGSDGPPCCYNDLDHANLVLLIGTNTADCHPVLWQRLLKRKRRDPDSLKIVVVDPRSTATAIAADLHLAIKPGSDLALLHGVAHLLVQKDWIDKGFIELATEGYTEFITHLSSWSPQRVADLCGITETDLGKLAELWGSSAAVLSAWSMGVNQSVDGSATVSAIINLHLLTGQIGRHGAGPFSLTGQPNAMGGREAGGLSHLLPGYRTVTNKQDRASLERYWGLSSGAISAQPGRHVWQQVEAMERGELGLWWVAATNPLVSLPSLDRVRAAVRNCDFVVLSEAYAGTETAEFAHLILPAAQWSEKEGVMTNSERRLTLCQAFREPPGQARADWQIFAELGQRLGFTAAFSYA